MEQDDGNEKSERSTLEWTEILPEPEWLSAKFGELQMTTRAEAIVNSEDLVLAVFRHSTLDWQPEERRACTRDEREQPKCTLVSMHQARCGQEFWLMTESRGLFTLIALPEEFPLLAKQLEERTELAGGKLQ